MTYTISKLHTFSASHQLAGLHDGHPCGRLHGHNYTLRVELTADRLDEHGFVLDYNLLAPFLKWVDDTLDHRHLNDVMGVQPSAEIMSRWLTEKARQILNLDTVTVAVSETPKTWAKWEG